MTDETPPTTTSETSVSRAKEEIVKEAKRIEEDALFSSKGHFSAAAIWSNFHLFIGIPTAVVAAVASGLAWAGEAEIAGGLAILVAGLASVVTFTNPQEKSAAHLSAGNSYDALRNKVRIFWTIDCWQESSDVVLTQRIKDISEEKTTLNRSCPQVSGFPYKLARKGILAGEAKHKVDES